MLHKTKSRQVAILKYGLSVPLFAPMVILSSATATAEKLTKAIESSPIVEVLSNPELSPIKEVKSPDLNRKIETHKKLKAKPEQPKNGKVQAEISVVKDRMNRLQNIMDYI